MPELMLINPNRRKKGKKQTPGKGRREMAVRKKRTRNSTTKRKSTTKRRRRKTTRALVPGRRGPRLRYGKRKRRRSNPRGGGNVNLPIVGSVNVVDIAGGTAGSIVAKMLPNLLAGKVGLPTTGALKYPVQLATGLAVSWLASNVLKMKGVGRMTALFVFNNVLTDLANEFLIGPAGMGAYMGDWPPSVYTPVTHAAESERFMGRYADVATDNRGVFDPLEDPTVSGVFEVGDVPHRFRPRF